MLGAQADHVQKVGFDLQDVHSTSEGKSFDYRVGVLSIFSSCTAQEVVYAFTLSAALASCLYYPAH